MKKLAVFSIALIFAAFMFAGCGGDDDDDDDDILGPDGDEYAGYMSMKAGSWSKYDISDPPGATDTYKWLGEDDWEGKQCYVMEFEMFVPGEGTTVVQVWLDKATYDAVLYLIKTDGTVMKMPVGQTPDVPGDETYDDPGVQRVGEDKYTTPTGKTVNAVIYKQTTAAGVNEYWTSSEVPFGSVKDLLNGEVQLQLYDFSSSGATRGITKTEAMNAESMTFPNIPDDDGDLPDDGGDDNPIGGIGTVTITVGPGARPTISVSQPIQTLLMMGGFMPVWSFESPDLGEPDGLAFAGPFQYGVTPNGATSSFPNAPDLVTGQSYTITVTGMTNAGVTLIGTYTFTR